MSGFVSIPIHRSTSFLARLGVVSSIKEANGMIRSKQKDVRVYMIAIAQGVLIGIVVFR